jgi:predicted metal-binding membrane protein
VNGPSAVLLLLAAGAWGVVVVVARGMGDAMTGTMGLSLGAFTVIWLLMMTAMMLPTIAPFAALYTRGFTEHAAFRTVELAAGYLLVWTLVVPVAYALASLAERVVSSRPTVATGAAAAILAMVGIYQLTPLKQRCLSRCRSPLGLLLTYGTARGRWRDVRVGIRHGTYCLACCWALMTVLVVVGFMNVAAMIVIAAVALAEKTLSWGPRLARVVGVLALALALAVLVRPTLATGMQPMPDDPSMTDQPMSA